jgi:glycosyltransferase involved in cell wall biosynthesis
VSPRVALVVTTTADDPGALLAARLRGLLEGGWDAHLFCKGQARAADPALADPDLRGHVELAPEAPRESMPFGPGLRGHRPQLVHFHSGWAAWKSLALVRSIGCRVVVSLREDGQDLALPDARAVWEGADLLLFPSMAALERAASRGWPRERAELLEVPAELLAQVGRRESPDGALRLLSAGPVVWEQGYEHSVHAVRLLSDMGVQCRYRILGTGDHLPAVAFARHQLEVADRVELLAPDGTAQLAAQLHRTDVFVDPAVTATTSPAALEAAQVASVPFVATRREGLLAAGGIVVERRRPRAMAEALARLAADADLRRRMGQAGARARHAPTVEGHVQRLESLYRRALER